MSKTEYWKRKFMIAGYFLLGFSIIFTVFDFIFPVTTVPLSLAFVAVTAYVMVALRAVNDIEKEAKGNE